MKQEFSRTWVGIDMGLQSDFTGAPIKMYDSARSVWTVHEGGYPPFISEEIAHGETESAYYQKLDLGEAFMGKGFTFATKEQADHHLASIVKEPNMRAVIGICAFLSAAYDWAEFNNIDSDLIHVALNHFLDMRDSK